MTTPLQPPSFVGALTSTTSTFVKSPWGRITVVALASSALTAVGIFTSQTIRRKAIRSKLDFDVKRLAKRQRDRRDDTDDELTEFGTAHHTRLSSHHRRERSGNGRLHHDEGLIKEQLSRNIAFLGEDGNDKVRNAFVVVVGLGGVGSTAAMMLVRSGVGRIRLIDFDQRHATATRADVGIPKVEACKSAFAQIAPWIQIDARAEQFTMANAPRLFEGKPDWVLDCIDNISTKCDLLAYCKTHNIRVMSSLGAASKADPSRVQIADISNTFEDPLARSVRRRLKQAGVVDGVPVVYSTERPKEYVRLLPLSDEELKKGNVEELAPLVNYRVRILPVLGPLPAMFGQAMSAYVLTRLAGFSTDPLPIKNRHKVYHKLLNDLVTREQRVFGIKPIGVPEEDIAYVFEEVFRGRSAVAPTYTSTPTPAMIRWRLELPMSSANIVVMTREEADRHEREVILGGKDVETVWGAQTVDMINRRLEEERVM